jgi:hypothetical protein
VVPKELSYTQELSSAIGIKFHAGLSWAKGIELHTGVECSQRNQVTHRGSMGHGN